MIAKSGTVILKGSKITRSDSHNTPLKRSRQVSQQRPGTYRKAL
jgi:hypothetical protein